LDVLAFIRKAIFLASNAISGLKRNSRIILTLFSLPNNLDKVSIRVIIIIFSKKAID